MRTTVLSPKLDTHTYPAAIVTPHGLVPVVIRASAFTAGSLAEGDGDGARVASSPSQPATSTRTSAAAVTANLRVATMSAKVLQYCSTFDHETTTTRDRNGIVIQ